MALNKFMHPRNLYKSKKPNFQELALKYPDFRKFVFPDVTGKLFLDFKHPDSLRQLSVTLLEEDFGLKLELPLDRLVPTVPLRLNYIHWLEDVLTASKADKGIKGIDIGTGSSCIYPLLSCRIHKDWTFLATEVDDKNFMYTQRNIENNGMKERITVKRANAVDGTVLCDILKDNPDKFDFCMCNPPFFADHVEAEAVAKSRSYSRADPKSVCTASFTESIVEGGEVNFVKKIIKDSMELGTKIRIYSSMIGKKSSLPPLKEELRRLKIPKFTTTEFCQGKTMRWGLAWTFDHNVNFPKSLFQESKKERPPLVYQVPRCPNDLDYDVTNICARLQTLLAGLKIQYDVTLNQKSLVRMTLVAKENTWSNQRRKRRQQKQQKVTAQMEHSTGAENIDKIAKCEPFDDLQTFQVNSPCEEYHNCDAKEKQGTISCDVTKNMQQNLVFKNICEVAKENGEKQFSSGETTNPKLNAENLSKELEDNKESVVNLAQPQCTTNVIKDEGVNCTPDQSKTKDNKKRKLSDSDIKSEIIDKTLESPAKRKIITSESGVIVHPEINVKCEQVTSSTTDAGSTSLGKKSTEEMANGYSELFGDSVEEKIFLKCLLKIKLSTPHVVIEMTWIEGENKESMHQVLQYIKNKMSVTPVTECQ
ncbi:RNA N6-adenosine-methyltransferase METTL16-like [Ylistrum balloti]|uniref:RNA N6-adenosine-methyltransferase METTL16-like n=1 Tax=Ylistrum balloti TaxID=509963 RepID=UPI002905F45A|nr:RNA N6-adenosine-methyltransferase METTL16-like [Ylistrum balloti]